MQDLLKQLEQIYKKIWDVTAKIIKLKIGIKVKRLDEVTIKDQLKKLGKTLDDLISQSYDINEKMDDHIFTKKVGDVDAYNESLYEVVSLSECIKNNFELCEEYSPTMLERSYKTFKDNLSTFTAKLREFEKIVPNSGILTFQEALKMWRVELKKIDDALSDP